MNSKNLRRMGNYIEKQPNDRFDMIGATRNKNACCIFGHARLLLGTRSYEGPAASTERVFRFLGVNDVQADALFGPSLKCADYTAGKNEAGWISKDRAVAQLRYAATRDKIHWSRTP